MAIAEQARRAIDLFEGWRQNSTLGFSELEYVENQLFRFNLWTSNNYIFQSPRASIDWRLRNAPLLQSAMDDLLDDLVVSLKNAQEQSPKPADGRRENQSAQPNVETTLDRLFRFSRAVRRSGILHRLVKIENRTEYGPDGVNLTSEFHAATTRLIEHYLKGCTATQELRGRLVKAICLRQQNFSYLKYQRETRAAVRVVPAQLPPRPTSTFAPSFSVVKPVASTTQEKKPLKYTPPLELRRSILTATTAQVQKIQLDPSVHSSVAAQESDIVGSNLDLPRPPNVPFGRAEWECPYCLVVCPAKDFVGQNWKKHIIADIMPFVCLLESCPNKTTLFQSAKDWLNHMKNEHTESAWTCLDHESKISFSKMHDFMEHIHDEHPGQFEDDDLHDLAEACFESSTTNFDSMECPFCPIPEIVEWTAHENARNHGTQHIAAHLVSFARISLDGFMDDNVAASDVSKSMSPVESYTNQVISGTIADELQSEFPQDDEEDAWYYPVSQIPAAAEEESWDFCAEYRQQYHMNSESDPVYKSFTAKFTPTHKADEETMAPVPIILNHLFHSSQTFQSRIEWMISTERAYIDMLAVIKVHDFEEQGISGSSPPGTTGLRSALDGLIKRHEDLVKKLSAYYNELPTPTAYFGDICDEWFQDAKDEYTSYFELAWQAMYDELGDGPLPLDIDWYEVIGREPGNYLEIPWLRLRRYPPFLSSLIDSKPEDEDHPEKQIISLFLMKINNLLASEGGLLGCKRSLMAHFEPFDRRHVEEKFPRADSVLLDRLGFSMTQRRAILKNREYRRSRPSGPKPTHTFGDRNEEERPRSTDSSKATTFDYQRFSNLPNVQSQSDQGRPASSGAEGITSGMMVAEVPPPPPGFSIEGAKFECPYCFLNISIQDEKTWRYHVFEDLRPYICIFPNCATPRRLYANLRDWTSHMQEVHNISEDQYLQTHCPLCDTDAGRIWTITLIHIAEHLKQLALFALPRESFAEEDPDFEANVPVFQHG